MVAADMTSAGLPGEAADMQALLRTGFGSLKCAQFLLLRVADAAVARAWLGRAEVTPASRRDDRAASSMQIALTAQGLRALGVAEDVMAGFAAEFRSGMSGDEARSRRLGDVGENAPSEWLWGGAEQPDLLVMLYADKDAAEWGHFIASTDFALGFRIMRRLNPVDMHGREPFGFADGISQPLPDWGEDLKADITQELRYRNRIALGEFVLGYRNEYGLYTDRPLLAEGSPGAELLAMAEDRAGSRDLGRNGSFLVVRELHQDVGGFWDFMRARGGAEAVALAEAMVGRRRDGAPLVAAGDDVPDGVGPDTADIRSNAFTYDADAAGMVCPVGAHVRRANPRTADMPGGPQSTLARLVRILGLCKPDLRADLVAASRFHRILRRGRPFGAVPAALPGMAMAADVPTGLYFMCLNANLPRQFEFVQNAWLHHAKFAGLDGEGDPVTGNRLEFPPGTRTDGFSQPRANGVGRRIEGLPRFVTVKGGAYFFLPGIRALRFIARQPG